MTTLPPPAICITEQDRNRLMEMMRMIVSTHCGKENLGPLVDEIDRATVVDAREVSCEVVTMNSRISIVDTETSEKMTFTLVYPDDSDPSADKISVIAPIGSAMLGHQTGDIVELDVPAGKRRFKIENVSYQPEAKRHFDL